MFWLAALLTKTHYWLNKVSNGFSGFYRLLLGDRKIRLILKWGSVKWKFFFFMIVFVEQFQHNPCCLCMTILSLWHNKTAFFTNMFVWDHVMLLLILWAHVQDDVCIGCVIKFSWQGLLLIPQTIQAELKLNRVVDDWKTEYFGEM